MRGEHGAAAPGIEGGAEIRTHGKTAKQLAPYEAFLRELQTAAPPNWIPANVLHSEIVERG